MNRCFITCLFIVYLSMFFVNLLKKKIIFFTDSHRMYQDRKEIDKNKN